MTRKHSSRMHTIHLLTRFRGVREGSVGNPGGGSVKGVPCGFHEGGSMRRFCEGFCEEGGPLVM